MKKLLLLLFLSSQAFGGVDANTVFLATFNNTLNDSSANANNLVQVGTVPFSTVNGVVYAGPFTASNYCDTNAALKTLVAGLTVWTIEWAMIPTDLSNSPIVLGTTGFNTFFQVHATLGIRCMLNGVGMSFVNPITAGVLTLIAYTYDGTKLRVYVNNSVVATLTQAGAWGTNANMFIGRDTSSGLQFNGLLSYLRISNIARTTFPTVDSAAGRTLKLNRLLTPRLGALMNFFETQAWAYPPDQWRDSKEFVKLKSNEQKTKVQSDLTKGIISVTLTPTLTTAFSPTLSSTITPLPSITVTPTPTGSPSPLATPSRTVTPTLTKTP